MSDSTQATIAVAFGVFIATVAAYLWFGPKAATGVLLIAVLGLAFIVDRVSKRADTAEAIADEALSNGDKNAEAIRELRAWCDGLRDALAVDTDDLAWQPEANPATDPIGTPQQGGPPTEEALEVAARQVRALMGTPAEDEWRSRFDFSGGRR